jgi:hypothetical protein
VSVGFSVNETWCSLKEAASSACNSSKPTVFLLETSYFDVQKYFMHTPQFVTQTTKKMYVRVNLINLVIFTAQSRTLLSEFGSPPQ